MNNAVGERFVDSIKRFAHELSAYGVRTYLFEQQVPGFRDPPPIPTYDGPPPSAVLGELLDQRVGATATYEEIRAAIVSIATEFPALRALDDLWVGDRRLVSEALTSLPEPSLGAISTAEEAATVILDEIARQKEAREDRDLRGYTAKGYL